MAPDVLTQQHVHRARALAAAAALVVGGVAGWLGDAVLWVHAWHDSLHALLTLVAAMSGARVGHGAAGLGSNQVLLRFAVLVWLGGGGVLGLGAVLIASAGQHEPGVGAVVAIGVPIVLVSLAFTGLAVGAVLALATATIQRIWPDVSA